MQLFYHYIRKSNNNYNHKKQKIINISVKVADWQIKTFHENIYAKSESKGWITGAFYMGLWYSQGYLSKEKFLPVVLKGWKSAGIGSRNGWEIGLGTTCRS